MKKHLKTMAISAGIFLAGNSLTAQNNTYPYPATGSIGIGTTNPLYPLDVNGIISSQVLGSGGRAGYHLYNSGAVSEWFVGQESSTSHNFKIQRIVSGNYSNFLDINNLGHVGIGTTNPLQPLHVVGNVQVDGSGSALMFETGSGTQTNLSQSTTYGGALQVQTPGGSMFLGPQNTLWCHVTTDRSKFYFNQPIFIAGGVLSSYQYADLSLQIGTTSGSSGMPAITIKGTGSSSGSPTQGYVGIGTTSPLELFHVNQGVLRLTGSNHMGGPMIVFGNSGASPDNGQWGIEYNAAAQGLNFWRPYPAPNLGNYFLFLSDQTGNVGIGTGTPKAKLTVNGNALIGDPSLSLPAGYNLYVQQGIITEKVHVTTVHSTDWPDYVFTKNYKLMSLNEVENFIASNNHLPEVPSANEVSNSGIDMATMDATLLKKIEELTLYMIELKKENVEQQQELNELKKQLLEKQKK
ncbi:MAG: hypothetical protein ACHQII_05365 [Bacteroidia bacterium]